MPRLNSACSLVAALTLCNASLSLAEEKPDAEFQDNASSPLAKLNFVDLRVRNYDVLAVPGLGDWEFTHYSIDGVTMLTADDRLAYKVNYVDSDFFGQSHQELSNIELSWAHIFDQGQLGDIKFKWGAGFEWNKNFGDPSKGTGSGSDLLTPQAGIGWMLGPTTQFFTLAQYFRSYSEDAGAPEVDRPAGRLIFMHMFPQTYSWVFIDNKFVVDRDNDNASGNMLEVQFGQMLNPQFGIYLEYYKGTGNSALYEEGYGLGLRFMLN
jgi:hypothetical protein